MKKINLAKKYVLPILFLWGIFSNTLADIVYDPINYEQNLITAVNSAQSLMQQAQQIRYQLQNLQQLSHYPYQDNTEWISQMDQMTQRGKALSYASQNVSDQFRETYPNYSSFSNNDIYRNQYNTWSTSTLDTFHNTLSAAHKSASHYQTEQQLLNDLKRQNQSSQGNLSAMQTVGAMSVEQINQLQSLKRLVSAQTNSQNAYMAYQVSRDSHDEKNLMEMNDAMSDEFPEYQNHDMFGEIKN